MRFDIGNYGKLSRIETVGSKEDVLRKFSGKTGKGNRQSRRYFLSNSSSFSSQFSEQFTSAHTRDTTYSISNISKNNSISQFMNKTFLKQGHLEIQNVLTKQVDENLG